MLAGGAFRNRQWLQWVRWTGKALIRSPRNAGYMLALPLRRVRRRLSRLATSSHPGHPDAVARGVTYAPGLRRPARAVDDGRVRRFGPAPAFALHSEAEGALLRRYAKGATCIVEIGVAEGASAWEIRQTADPDGTIFLIDPYGTGRLPGAEHGAPHRRSATARFDGPSTRVDPAFSQDASVGWDRPIDFLMIDGDHSYEAVERDWLEWSPHVDREASLPSTTRGSSRTAGSSPTTGLCGCASRSSTPAIPTGK